MREGAQSDNRSVLEWLLAEVPDLALTAVATAAAALWWPDSESGARATAFCRSVFFITWLPFAWLQTHLTGGHSTSVAKQGKGTHVLRCAVMFCAVLC